MTPLDHVPQDVAPEYVALLVALAGVALVWAFVQWLQRRRRGGKR